jgi:hypothetical protein
MWAVAGSRSLPAGGAGAIASALAGLPPGSRVAVGCCVGADAAVLAALPASRLAVFAAFGPGGAGACSLSAVGPVALAASAGASVSWWAGGGPAVPLYARLAARTRAVVAAASSGLLLFPASPSSRGSCGARAGCGGGTVEFFGFGPATARAEGLGAIAACCGGMAVARGVAVLGAGQRKAC